MDLSADFVSLLVYVVVLLYIPPVASASQVFHLSITELLRNIFLLSRDVLTDPFPILLFTVLTYEEDFKMILLKKKRKLYMESFISHTSLSFQSLSLPSFAFTFLGFLKLKII